MLSSSAEKPIFSAFKLKAGLATLVFAVFGYCAFLLTPAAKNDSRPTLIQIMPGTSLKQVVGLLDQNHLIKNASAFKILAYVQRKQNKIQIGEFELTPAMSAGEILHQITDGQSVLYPVTIPEGQRITEIAGILATQGLVDEDAFIASAKNETLIQSLGIPISNLEGYLFPETYHFTKFTPADKIVRTMVDTFEQRVMQAELLEEVKQSGLSLHEVITLASVIEKETGMDSERNRISSVFHNRLKLNMKLQTDPSVIYAIENFDGNIRKKDLFIDSPYNTYKYPGLPPGPIANPGIKSIQAALRPETTEFLFFVSRQDGSHQFSTNLSDHNRAVSKYQLQKVKHSR